MQDNERAINIFRALGDATRWSIILEIKDEEHSVSSITTKTGMTQSAVSHQLQKLKLFNIVKSEKRGKEVYYSLADDHVKSIVELVIEHVSHE